MKYIQGFHLVPKRIVEDVSRICSIKGYRACAAVNFGTGIIKKFITDMNIKILKLYVSS
jgi:hypothetical protein